MATFVIGDVHGCYERLRALLDKIGFHSDRHELWFVGDVVGRGPDSLSTLCWLYDHRDSVRLVLGNHDIHLLLAMAGVHAPKPADNLQPVLDYSGAAELFEWLRRQPLLYEDGGDVMVHAGLHPRWTLQQARTLAAQVQSAFSSDDYMNLFTQLYGDTPDDWDDVLSGNDRLRCIVNVMTRMRICDGNGRLRLGFVGTPAEAPAGYHAWFDVPHQHDEARIICGHWSTLGLLVRRDVVALDSGCLWGGRLSALELDTAEIIQV